MFDQHTTTKQNHKPTPITQYNPKFEIWSVFISSLISNTTELMNKTKTTNTGQSPTNKTQPILIKQEHIKIQPTITSTTTKANH